MKKTSFSLMPLVVLAVFVTGALSAYTIYRCVHSYAQQQQEFIQENKQSLKTISTTLTKELGTITTLAKDLATQVAKDHVSLDACAELFKKNLATYEAIQTIGVAYAPYAYKNDTRLASLQCSKQGKDDIVRVPIQNFYDYTTSAWYAAALQKKAQWLEPYFESSSNTIITRFVQPLFTFNKEKQYQELVGTLIIDVPIHYLNETINKLSMSKQSYAMMVARNGILLAHPSEEYIENKKSIFDIAQLPGKKDFIRLGTTLAKHDYGTVPLYDTHTQQHLTAFFERIPKTEWTLVIIAPEKQSLIPTQAMRHTLTHALLAILLFLITFSLLLFRAYRFDERHLWFASTFASFMILASIGCLWGFDVTSTEQMELHNNVISSQMGLERFLYMHKKLKPHLYKEETHFIPTGLFIYSIALGSDAKITINGHIWQKYDLTKDGDLEHGVIIFNATKQDYTKVYEHTDKNIQTTGWRFSAELKASFDQTKYPFDQQNVALTLGHKNYQRNVILTPDFEAFTAAGVKHPEIDPSTNIGQWKTKNTYSFYQLTDYVTDFGIEDYTRQKDFPNLCFNILIRRNFIDPLIASFLPIAIILMIVFSIFLVTGFSTAPDLPTLILRLCSSIFFATAVAHQTFQRILQSPTITYFEYFYFVLYVIILLTTVNGSLYGYNRGGWFILYKENVIPRLLYWPLVLTALLGNTLLFFY